MRYTDDVLILNRSKSVAHNALKVAKDRQQGEPLLPVNAHKSRIVHSFENMNYLGVKIYTGYTRIKRERLRAFKDNVKGITRRNSPVNWKMSSQT